jgi:hypothetical protein
MHFSSVGDISTDASPDGNVMVHDDVKSVHKPPRLSELLYMLFSFSFQSAVLTSATMIKNEKAEMR